MTVLRQTGTLVHSIAKLVPNCLVGKISQYETRPYGWYFTEQTHHFHLITHLFYHLSNSEVLHELQLK